MTPMDILRKLRQLEGRIAGTLDRTVGEIVQSGAREPLEIVHAVVDAVALEVQSSGRGRRVFPFNEIAVTVLAPSREARARLEAVFDHEPALQNRIFARLRADGCAVERLRVSVQYVARAPKQWERPDFHIDFARVADDPPPAPAAVAKPRRIDLTVLHGTAEKRSYSFGATPIDLGRCAEVRDSQQRLIRTNHVAFVEQPDDVNRSVSRRHAHIGSGASEEFRLYDDGSERGTGIIRDGRAVAVPRGGRGVRLCSGDEILLGEARVRVRFDVD